MPDSLRELDHRLRNLAWPIRLRGDLARERTSALLDQLRRLFDATARFFAPPRPPED